jgi:hypothetical protein
LFGEKPFSKNDQTDLEGTQTEKICETVRESDEHEEERAERLGVEKDVNESKAVRVFEQIRDPR